MRLFQGEIFRKFSELKVAVGWNRGNMEFVGIWPEPSRTHERLPNFKALLYLSIIIVFGVGPQSANLFFIWGDLELVTENLSTANIPGINAMIKLIFALYYKECTYKIFHQLAKLSTIVTVVQFHLNFFFLLLLVAIA